MKKFKDLLNIFNPLNYSVLKKRNVRLILGTILVFIISAAIASVDFLPEQVSIEAGQVSETNINAPRTINYIDEEKTEELREEAAEEIEDYYEKDLTVIDEIENEIQDIFILVSETQDNLNEFEDELEAREDETKEGLIAEEAEAESDELIDKLNEDYGVELTNEAGNFLLNLSEDDLAAMEEEIKAIVDSFLSQGVREEETDQIRDEIRREFLQLNGNGYYNEIVGRVAIDKIRANEFLDQEQTEELREKAREEIEPVQRTIIEGENVLRQGSVATEDDIRILEALELLQPDIDYFNILGMTLAVLLFFGLTIYYIINYQPNVLEDEGVFYLLGLMPIIMISISQLIKYLPLDHLSFLVPVATASIIITILVNTNLAIIFTIGLSFLVALVTGGNLMGVSVLIVSGLTGIYSVNKLSQRSDLVRAGFIVGGATAFAILIFMLADPLVDSKEILFNLPLGIANGLLVTILTNGMLPYIENVFGVTSPVKLLELSNPRHPLLKRLLMEAPGSYHHSIIVGNLAEAAADEVGADSLLTRVGAYYHDIGKIKRAYFFTENQIGEENPHNKLSPNLSTLIITSHIKDGVELAEEYKLPEIVINLIKQHHGTSLVSFFYQEAVYDEKYENVDEDDFRYDGPKPQTKEAALLMLADIVEAAVRSNAAVQNNPGKLEGFVRELIKDRLNSGQLDESDLTLKDLDKVANSFINILKGIFHNRIEYPDNIAQELKGGS